LLISCANPRGPWVAIRAATNGVQKTLKNRVRKSRKRIKRKKMEKRGSALIQQIGGGGQ